MFAPQDQARLLLIAQPGSFRRGLISLLRTVPELKIASLGSCAEALEVAPEDSPDVIIIEGWRPSLAENVDLLKIRWPSTRVMVFVDLMWSHTGGLELGGIDRVLSTHVPAGQLLLTIKGLISSGPSLVYTRQVCQI